MSKVPITVHGEALLHDELKELKRCASPEGHSGDCGRP